LRVRIEVGGFTPIPTFPLNQGERTILLASNSLPSNFLSNFISKSKLVKVNFYEAGLPAKEVIGSIGPIGSAVNNLLDLLPEEAKESVNEIE